MKELDAARESLGAIQRQLEQELDKAAAQRDDLLPRIGGSGGAHVPSPGPAEQKSRESIERFQKLCRDAKRKAIGA